MPPSFQLQLDSVVQVSVGFALGRPRQYQNGGWIRYVMTVAGPEPLETRRSALYYQHYLTRQLQPVADAILPFVDDDFTALIDRQLGLF